MALQFQVAMTGIAADVRNGLLLIANQLKSPHLTAVRLYKPFNFHSMIN